MTNSCLLRSSIVLVTAALSACTSFEYEEEVHLQVDGSGRMRVSGSAAVLRALHPDVADIDTLAGFRSYFETEPLAVELVRETEREGRRYLHVQGNFDDWSELCRHPAFRDRSCAIEVGEESTLLELEVLAPSGPPPSSLDAEAMLAFRFHLPSTVRYHNSPTSIQRGNILEWKRPVAQHFGSTPVEIEVRFDRETVLTTTARILALALGAVVVVVVSAIGLMVRKGRRQLADESREAAPSKTR